MMRKEIDKYYNGNIIVAHNYSINTYKGVKYDINSNILYIGEIKNFEPHGEEILFYSNKNINYEGKFINDKFDSIGKLYFPDGHIMYEDQFMIGKKNYIILMAI